jgi:hypothetical protein
MPDFGELLKNSISGLNDNYNVAVADLNNVIAGVDAAVTGLTSGLVNVRLQEINKTPDHTLYLLTLVRKRMGDSLRLGAFRIRSTGYPIEYGSLRKEFDVDGTLEGKEQLEEYFAAMLSERNSPMVVQIAFSLR